MRDEPDVKLHVGYDGTDAALNTLCVSGAKIDYLYTGMCIEVMGGGRLQGIVNFHTLKRHVEIAKCSGMKFCIAMNDPVLHDYESRRNHLLESAHICRDLGVDAITIANPKLLVDLYGLGIELFFSTIIDVDSVSKLRMILELPFHTLVPSYTCNRNLDLLREMAELLRVNGRCLMLIVDELCSVPCPFRAFHFSAQGTQQRDLSQFFVDHCDHRFEKSPHLLLANSSIPPQLLKVYTDVCEHFKLSTRMVSAERTVELVRMYREGKMKGNYFTLIRKGADRYYIDSKALEAVVHLWPNCKNQCKTCGKCFELELNPAEIQ